MFPIPRRDFLKGAAAATALTHLAHVGDFAFLRNLPLLGADDTKVRVDTVALSPELEPVVRLLEGTPRDKILDTVVEQIRTGTSYQQLLAAVLLAGVRGIKPRPVGFKFHAVLVINSAHLAAQAATDNDRWLPLLWAIDNFKVSQAANQKDNAGWMMSPSVEAKAPSLADAKKQFIDMMDNWDEGADVPITYLARHAGAAEVVELLWRYGARDFRDIGHKAIYVANSWRTLQAIGWRHAEPVLRSLTFALVEHEGDNPAKRDAEADQPWRENLKRAADIRKDWHKGHVDADATTDLLDTLRTATFSEASGKVVELLNKEIAPASVWDALFLAAGELIMRQQGIVGLHTITTTNALYQAYQLSGDDETRRLMMLQAAAFLPLFRKRMESGKLRDDVKIHKFEPADLKGKDDGAIEEILGDVSKDRDLAARKTLAWLGKEGSSAASLMAAARRLVFNKGDDSHDYKFSSAALEDYYNISPKWRSRYLASAMFRLRGTTDKDNDLVKRAKAALANG